MGNPDLWPPPTEVTDYLWMASETGGSLLELSL